MALSFFQPDIVSAVRNSEVFCPQKDYRSRHYAEQAFIICIHTAKLNGLWTGNSELYTLFQLYCYSGTSQMFNVDPSCFSCHLGRVPSFLSWRVALVSRERDPPPKGILTHLRSALPSGQLSFSLSP